jgi:glycine cleavage system H protein
MAENSKDNSRVKSALRPSTFSRRQALQRLGITLGTGVAATLSLMSACKNAGQTVVPTTSTTPIPTIPSSIQPTLTSMPTMPTASKPATSTAPTQTTPASTTTATMAPSITGFKYVDPTEPAPVVAVPDSTCTVATDRKYSFEHVWAKLIRPDIAILGITTTLVAILYEPYKIALPKVGQKLVKDDGVGEVEGFKVSTDLITPVTGEVLQVNTFLEAFDGEAMIAPLNYDPYNSGWILAVKLTDPGEFDGLLTPEQYLERLGKLEPTNTGSQISRPFSVDGTAMNITVG